MKFWNTDKLLLKFKKKIICFLVADTQLYKRLCLSVGTSVGPWWSSWKVWKRAFRPLPTRPQLVLAVYPALFLFCFVLFCFIFVLFFFSFFSRGRATLYEALSVRRLVCWSVGEHESKSGKTSVSAPAHPSATGIGCVSGLVFVTVTGWKAILIKQCYRFLPYARDFVRLCLLVSQSLSPKV